MSLPINRLEFFHAVARGGLATSLVGVGIAALHGTKDVSECFNHNYCDTCWGYTGCSLPEKKEVPDERTEKTRPA